MRHRRPNQRREKSEVPENHRHQIFPPIPLFPPAILRRRRKNHPEGKTRTNQNSTAITRQRQKSLEMSRAPSLPPNLNFSGDLVYPDFLPPHEICLILVGVIPGVGVDDCVGREWRGGSSREYFFDSLRDAQSCPSVPCSPLPSYTQRS